jgi:hypothetical protein
MGWNYHRSKERMKERKQARTSKNSEMKRGKKDWKRMTGEQTDDEI